MYICMLFEDWFFLHRHYVANFFFNFLILLSRQTQRCLSISEQSPVNGLGLEIFNTSYNDKRLFLLVVIKPLCMRG